MVIPGTSGAPNRELGKPVESPLAVEPEQAVGEGGDRWALRIRRFPMRRMAHAGEHRHLDGAGALLLGDRDLARRPIGIAITLDDQYRHADIAEIFRDIPGAKSWMKPGIVPAAEGGNHVAVPARQPPPQAPRLEGRPGPRDLGNRNVLDHEMRRDQDEPANAVVLNAPGIDDGDRGAVGMSDQESPPK